MEEAKTNRGKGRGRGRGKKKAVECNTKIQESVPSIDNLPQEAKAIMIDMDADITQLEAPTFSTINKGPPEPMLRLCWDHKTHLIGEKVMNPMIHCCDTCEAPILVYGRMIPCKHVFCISCAEKENKMCPRCHDKVIRIERTGLGSVFMCTFGGSRYETTGCRRTYLSQRDLQAHINHRHVSCGTASNKDGINDSQASSTTKTVPTMVCRTKPSVASYHVPVVAAGDPRVPQTSNTGEFIRKIQQQQLQSPSSHTSSSSPQSRQSIHQTPLPHVSDPRGAQSTTAVPHPFSPLSSSTSNIAMAAPSPDIVSQMMMTSFRASNPVNLSMQLHDPIMEVKTSPLNLSRTPPISFPSQNYTLSPLFRSQTTLAGPVPFPVPPPGQPVSIHSSQPQFFVPPIVTTYPAPLPRPPAISLFTCGPSGPQNLISQSPLTISTSSSSRRNQQFQPEPVIPPPPFPVPPPSHRWPPPSQSNQTRFY